MAHINYEESLWVEEIPKILGAQLKQTLCRLGLISNEYQEISFFQHPYIYAILLIGLNMILYAVQYYQTGSAVLLDNSSWIVFPIVFLLATFTNRHLRDRYAETLATIKIEERTQSECEVFQRLTPISFKLAFYLIFLIVYYAYIFGFGRIATITAYEGITGLIIWLVLAPFGYVPILIETITIYFSLHFLLPRWFNSHSIRLDIFDPDNLGGLRPIGELLKYSYYLFSVALTLFTMFIYLPFIFPQYFFTPYQPPDRIITIFILALWVVGTLSLAYSILKMHQYMRLERQDYLQTVEQQLEEQLPSRYDFGRILEVKNVDNSLDYQLRVLEQAQQTHEVPVTFSMWTQIVASAVLPIVVELLLSTAVSGL